MIASCIHLVQIGIARLAACDSATCMLVLHASAPAAAPLDGGAPVSASAKQTAELLCALCEVLAPPRALLERSGAFVQAGGGTLL